MQSHYPILAIALISAASSSAAFGQFGTGARSSHQQPSSTYIGDSSGPSHGSPKILKSGGRRVTPTYSNKKSSVSTPSHSPIQTGPSNHSVVASQPSGNQNPIVNPQTFSLWGHNTPHYVPQPSWHFKTPSYAPQITYIPRPTRPKFVNPPVNPRPLVNKAPKNTRPPRTIKSGSDSMNLTSSTNLWSGNMGPKGKSQANLVILPLMPVALSPSGYNHAKNFIQKETKKTLNEVEGALPDDPEVKAQIDEMKEAFSEGKPIDANAAMDLLTKTGEAKEKQEVKVNGGINDLKTLVGSDPTLNGKINTLVEEIEDAFAGEGPVNEDVIKDLVNEVENSNLSPADIDKAKDTIKEVTGITAKQLTKEETEELAQTVFELPGLAKANSMLNEATPVVGAPALIPTGPTPVMVMPVLATGKIYSIPGGGLIVGTGGWGQIDVLTVDAAALLNFPLGTGPAFPEMAPNDDGQWASGDTVLRNPLSNNFPIEFTIGVNDGYMLMPGESQRVPGAAGGRVRFHRGPGLGATSYRLDEGTYSFEITDEGLELYTESFGVTIDNSNNDNDFHCIVDNRGMTIPAGAEQTLDSIYPIIVRFDRGGNDQEAVKQIAEEDGYLTVAVNPRDGLWDLFPLSTPPTATAKSDLQLPPTRAEKMAVSTDKQAARAAKDARLIAILEAAHD